MRSLVTFLFVFFTTLACGAQDYDPLTLSKKICSRDTFPDMTKYITGEYKGHPSGKDFRSGLKISFKLIGQNKTTAVVNVTLSDSAGKEFDTYLHFEKDMIWKACAFRALAMTGMIEQAHEEAAKLTPAQVDSIIASPPIKFNGQDLRQIRSKEDYQFLLGNTALTISSDKELISHFIKNRAEFENIRNALIAKGIMKQKDNRDFFKRDKNIYKKVRALLIDNVSANFEGTKRSLNFLIGGILDNSVGYFYIKDPKNVPEMSPGHFIMIRALGGGWYLYKTT